MSNPPTSHSSEPIASDEATALVRALDQNTAVQDAVEQSAAELVIINAVLKHEIPDHVQVGDVAKALQRTDELEVKINDSVQDLAQVNKMLAQEIDERVDLEQALAEARAALAAVQNNGR